MNSQSRPIYGRKIPFITSAINVTSIDGMFQSVDFNPVIKLIAIIIIIVIIIIEIMIYQFIYSTPYKIPLTYDYIY